MHREDLRRLLEEQRPGQPPDEAEIDRLHAAVSHLTLLPDLEPSPETWKNIESRLPAPVQVRPASGRPFAIQPWIGSAAAALLLVAALSFAVAWTTARTGALPVVVETDKALMWNDPFTAPTITTIAIPDVGSLKVNQNATLRFLGPRSVVLEAGEVFAEIIPSGKGFEIRSGESTVRVKGTKFGVRSPSTVYVVEGAVEVSGPRGRLHLGPHQASVESRLVEIGPEDYLRWLAQYERPAVRLSLDLLDRATITPGGPLKWNLILETDSFSPLTLGKPRDVSQYFSLLVEGVSVPLDVSRVCVKSARTGPNGLVRLDSGHPCVLECSVDPGLFHDKGRVGVRAVFASGSPAAETIWEGIVRSPSVTVEVR